MMFMYDNRYSVVLLRSKNEVKLPTQSAEKLSCMGKCAFKMLAELFLKSEKTSDNRSFFTQCAWYHSPGVKSFTKKDLRWGNKTIHKLKSKILISQK